MMVSFRAGLMSALGLGLAAVLVASCATAPASPTAFDKKTVQFLGLAAIPGGPGATADQSGLPHTLLEDGQSYQDAFDGIGSGFAYTGFANRYLALSDRGPNKVQYKGGEAVDFTTSYPNRFQIIDVTLKAVGAGWEVAANLVGTSLLTDEAGQGFTGISTAFIGADPARNRRLDPEGIRVAPDGTIWISDEYGPVMDHFDQSGKRLGSLTVPANFLIGQPAPTLAEEMRSENNARGRFTNRGAEGLAISPDGKKMVVAMQSALIQDGGANGLGTRFMVYDLTDLTKAPKQLVYVCDSTKLAISEIVAINDHQFLVDERDGTAGPKGVKRLYFVDLNQAATPTDVSSVERLPLEGSAAGIVPLKKILFADLGAILNSANAYTSAAGLPDKIEGLAFGPDLPDGRHLLLATNDNDYAGTFPNYIFAFAVDAKALPEFQPVKLNPGVRFIP